MGGARRIARRDGTGTPGGPRRGADAGERRGSDRLRFANDRGRVFRRRVSARYQGSRAGSRLHRGGACRRAVMSIPSTTSASPDRFGAFGGRYVPETLIPALDELDAAYEAAREDPSFREELSTLLATYVGR